MFNYLNEGIHMEDYIKNGLKEQLNADGKKVDIEVKKGAVVETTYVRTEKDKDGNITKQSRVDKQHKKRTSRRGWGRMYEMDFMSAIELMVENSKSTYKIFKYLLDNASKNNHVKVGNNKQVDVVRDMGLSKATVSPIMKFLANQEFVCKVSDGLMINPFLCAKNGIDENELYRIQTQWDEEIGYYGQERVRDSLKKEIVDIKKSKAKSFSRLHK